MLSSVEFHEKGRRHQENVKKRLAHISRTSAKAQRDSDKVDLQIKAMEAAALAAYQMDVQNNADLTSIAINKKVEKNNLAIKNGEKKVWQEAKSKDGNIYYWNMMTNETKWEKPAEGYTSLEEQEKEKFDEAAKQLRAIERERQKEGLLRIQEQRKEEAEEKARLAREKMKERAVKNDLEPIQYGPIIEPGKTNPYGRWEKVKESAPVVDLQLPPQQEYYAPVIELEPEPVVKEFKERTIESLDEGGPSTFKKRKFGGGAKRNTRQRLDDD